ncbi:uncharacterized protein LOC123269131 [Cotesia glomerata]|uniref:uncharacterized protein LOC123269131 n=1 Tax=Cotesia glomerata TaxID=32391 RepID=UPI001D0109E4|nr:uncharacterized protein LOC123269131 [Cotesia glomerata]
MCPTITPKDVDVTRLVGDWEEWERSTNAKDETESCGKLSFSAPDANGDVKLIFSAASSIVGGNSVLGGIARFDQNKITIDLHLPVLGIITNMTYYMLENDYDNYYVVWSCQQFRKGYIPTVYVKVRSLDSVNGLEAIVKNALKKRGLPMVQLTKEKRAGCADCFSDD